MYFLTLGEPAARARRAAYCKSILDMVREDTEALSTTLGQADRRKMDEYLTSVREIEIRIQNAEKSAHVVKPGINKPSGVPVSFGEYVSLMLDLQLAAFRADITRVSTMMIGREGSMRTYPEINIADSHHPLTHHRNNPDFIEAYDIETPVANLYMTLLDRAGEHRGSIGDSTGKLVQLDSI